MAPEVVVVVVVCCDCLLWLFRTRVDGADCLCQHFATNLLAGALDENWRSTPDDLEEREKWPKKSKKPFTAAITLLKANPSLLRAAVSAMN